MLILRRRQQITLVITNYKNGNITESYIWRIFHINGGFSAIFMLVRNTTLFNSIDIHVTVHRDKFLTIKPTRCTNFSNLFLEWKSTCFGQFLCSSSGVFRCTHSNDIRHTGLLTACEQEHLLLLTSCLHNLYDVYHCCVYNEKLLMTERGTVRNM
jgi:hypothetical protein